MLQRILTLILLFLVPCAGNVSAQYVLLTGNPLSGILHFWNLDGDGKLSFRSSFDMWQSSEYFRDPQEFLFSPAGRYLFVTEFDGDNGLLYSIDGNLDLRTIAELTNGCGGGGFTRDEAHFFTYAHERPSQGIPEMRTFQINETTAVLLSSTTVPSTAALRNNYLVSDHDEVMGNTLNGYRNSGEGFAVYTFNRETNALSLTQYLEGVGCSFSDLMPEGDMVVHTRGNELGVLLRGADGVWRRHWTFTPPWPDIHSWGGEGIAFTPNCKYVIVALLTGWTDIPLPETGGGLAVFKVLPDKTLQLHFHLPRFYLHDMAMTPDGRYVVAPYWETDSSAEKFGVFRFDSDAGTLTEVYTLPRQGSTAGMAFFPQALPPAGADEKAWSKYSESRAPGPQSLGVAARDSKPRPPLCLSSLPSAGGTGGVSAAP